MEVSDSRPLEGIRQLSIFLSIMEEMSYDEKFVLCCVRFEGTSDKDGCNW